MIYPNLSRCLQVMIYLWVDVHLRVEAAPVEEALPSPPPNPTISSYHWYRLYKKLFFRKSFSNWFQNFGFKNLCRAPVPPKMSLNLLSDEIVWRRLSLKNLLVKWKKIVQLKRPHGVLGADNFWFVCFYNKWLFSPHYKPLHCFYNPPTF